MHKIIHNEFILAIIIEEKFKAEGISFFTPPDFSQQLGYMNRPEGYKIKPHIHKPVPRQVTYTQEVLFIKSGKVRIDFYDEEKEFLKSHILKKGDIILLASGGHGFEMLEDSEIVEVKQGPYCGEIDKERFDVNKIT